MREKIKSKKIMFITTLILVIALFAYLTLAATNELDSCPGAVICGDNYECGGGNRIAYNQIDYGTDGVCPEWFGTYPPDCSANSYCWDIDCCSIDSAWLDLSDCNNTLGEVECDCNETISLVINYSNICPNPAYVLVEAESDSGFCYFGFTPGNIEEGNLAAPFRCVAQVDNQTGQTIMPASCSSWAVRYPRFCMGSNMTAVKVYMYASGYGQDLITEYTINQPFQIANVLCKYSRIEIHNLTQP